MKNKTNKQIHNHEYKNKGKKKKKRKKDGTTIYNKTCHEIYLHQKELYNNFYNINHLSSHKNIN